MASRSEVVPLHVAERPTKRGWSGREQPLAPEIQVVVAFAITTAKGVVLFETGCGRPSFPTVTSEFGRHLLDFWDFTTRPLEDELARHGLSTGDVRAVVNSHLHWDHCGGNPLFPGVPIYVQAAEYQAARTGGINYTVPDWVEFPGVEFVVVDGDARIAEGLRVIATPGHSPGHQSLILDTRDGPVAFAGQAIYRRADYEQLITGGITDSWRIGADGEDVHTAEVAVSAQRLHDLKPHRVYFSHDHDIWERPRR